MSRQLAQLSTAGKVLQMSTCGPVAGQSVDAGFDEHVALRRAGIERREHGRPARELIAVARVAIADVGARCRMPAAELERRNLEPDARQATAGALRAAEQLNADAWQQLDGAAAELPESRPGERAGALLLADGILRGVPFGRVPDVLRRDADASRSVPVSQGEL